MACTCYKLLTFLLHHRYNKSLSCWVLLDAIGQQVNPEDIFQTVSQALGILFTGQTSWVSRADSGFNWPCL